MIFKKIIIAALAVLGLNISSYAQNPKVPVPCNDVKVHNKLVAINKELEAKHYKLALFLTDNIPSKAYVPVTIKLEKGVSYQINFVANSKATRYELRMANTNKQELIKEKIKGNNEKGNVISKSFVPTESGEYIIVISQTVSGENCAGLSVMKK